MIYLTGAKNPTIADDLAAGRIGLLQTPRSRYRLDDVAVWALDNGCYTDAYPGDDAYLQLLDHLEPHQDRCLFVAAPDVVGDAEATLDNFERMADRITARGWPVALVGQDGMEMMPVPWYAADWLFVGGSTDWKLGPGAAELILQARERGKSVHVGRVNSRRRLMRFRHVDSVDGTYLAFGPDLLAPRLRGWLREADHPTLWAVTA